MMAPSGDRFFRSEQVLGSVLRCCRSRGQPPRLDAGGHDAGAYAAVLPAEPARHRFRFPLAACGGLGREEGVFILFSFIGRERRETPSALLRYATGTGATLPRL